MGVGVATAEQGIGMSDFTVALIIALAFIGVLTVFRALSDPGTGGH